MKFKPTKCSSTNVFGHGTHICRWKRGCLDGGTENIKFIGCKNKTCNWFQELPWPSWVRSQPQVLTQAFML